ncbi:MAG: DEAD/DEAH box helicase family protein [Stagnimonas sp.]|nr:DEAD/DEAH box helicase family protein [Stagnimonas sp.]
MSTPLPLAVALSKTVAAASLGLEAGAAPLLEQVTPVTAALLKFWFQTDYCDTRAINFHEGQRRAILNTIYAHEVLGVTSLKSLYEQAAPELLLTGDWLTEVNQTKHTHPKYCLKMATGTGKTWVLQALLVWQVLNKSATPEDARFTRRFLVVAPGLIVYERLLDAFMGKQREGVRDFATSDLYSYRELFIPEGAREQLFGFVRNNACAKTEIGLKSTGNGLIALTNWHLLAGRDEEEEADTLEARGADVDAAAVVRSIFPISPGTSAGNALDQLDRAYARGGVLDYLAALPDLMVFNDEAHHIHEVKAGGEVTEVEWQKSLSRIAETKGRQFVQVDFSATPYNQVGSGKKARKAYFPHVIVDFDLKEAMRAGLVKSLVLDKRKELGALPLEFKAERDADGNIALSEGQRVMLRAGLAKLRKLETDFAVLDASRRPKMLVVCEDTSVTPVVQAFLEQEGLNEGEVLRVDSNRKGEVGEVEWAKLREQLFDVDKRTQPRVIVSVLMLREGFDVNNICVIVPLRSSQAQILLEQTLGRGLRLMWRGPDYDPVRRENRERINKGQEPSSLIDILSIIEHPAFQAFYDELTAEGLAGETTEESDGTSGIGDLLSVGLREGFEEFDFAIPFILREADETLRQELIAVDKLTPFTHMGLPQLKGMLGKGDTFISHDLQSSTLFGDYRVNGAAMNVGGYNDYLSRLTRRIQQALSQPLKGNRVSSTMQLPHLQVNPAYLTACIDDYIRRVLFGASFEPLEDENWRLLLLQPVLDHVVKHLALALIEAENVELDGEAEVSQRFLSEVTHLPMRESCSLLVQKCIYERLAFPARSGGLERAFIEWANVDASIEAFCKVHEQKHSFVQLRYVKDDGLPGHYSPDFLVRTAERIYLVETKAQGQLNHPNVQRKCKAALNWCARLNGLAPEHRGDREWAYVLLGERAFAEWRSKHARLGELLAYARLVQATAAEQTSLSFH